MSSIVIKLRRDHYIDNNFFLKLHQHLKTSGDGKIFSASINKTNTNANSGHVDGTNRKRQDDG